MPWFLVIDLSYRARPGSLTFALRPVVKHLKRQCLLKFLCFLSLVNGSLRAYLGNLLRVQSVNDHNPDLHINLAAS